MRACNFIKKGLQHRCCPVKLEKFLRALFFTEDFRWLLLKLLSFFTLKNTFVRKRRDVKNWQVLLLKWKNASFVAMNMILKTIPKTRLVLFVTLIDKLCSYQSNFFPYKQILFAMYFFFDFLISLITETIRSSCLFQFIRPILKFLQWC